MSHIRFTDPLPLRGLAPGLTDLLLESAEPGGQLEVILDVRPDALVVVALTAATAVGASIATCDGDLVTVIEEVPHAALCGEAMRKAVTDAARKRWPGWELRRVSHAA